MHTCVLNLLDTCKRCWVLHTWWSVVKHDTSNNEESTAGNGRLALTKLAFPVSGTETGDTDSDQQWNIYFTGRKHMARVKRARCFCARHAHHYLKCAHRTLLHIQSRGSLNTTPFPLHYNLIIHEFIYYNYPCVILTV